MWKEHQTQAATAGEGRTQLFEMALFVYFSNCQLLPCVNFLLSSNLTKAAIRPSPIEQGKCDFHTATLIAASTTPHTDNKEEEPCRTCQTKRCT